MYGTHSIEVKDEKIVHALIVVHGGGRNADHYFSTGVTAALLANALDGTIVIAPRFASQQGSCNDILASDEINWDCGQGGAGGWRAGSVSSSGGELTSFDFMDTVLSKLAEAATFPKLKTITVAGFSAGGQYVQRYQMVNRQHEKLRVPVTYVVGSPSSYGYPDPLRPVPDGSAFAAFADTQNCTTYDRWPFGLSSRSGYSAPLSEEQMRHQLISRPVTYLIGELESPESPALDVSCPAMAQGRSRLQRGRSFLKYITEKYGAKQKMIVVRQCGHNDRCVFTDDVAIPFRL